MLVSLKAALPRDGRWRPCDGPPTQHDHVRHPTHPSRCGAAALAEHSPDRHPGVEHWHATRATTPIRAPQADLVKGEIYVQRTAVAAGTNTPQEWSNTEGGTLTRNGGCAPRSAAPQRWAVLVPMGNSQPLEPLPESCRASPLGPHHETPLRQLAERGDILLPDNSHNHGFRRGPEGGLGVKQTNVRVTGRRNTRDGRRWIQLCRCSAKVAGVGELAVAEEGTGAVWGLARTSP